MNKLSDLKELLDLLRIAAREEPVAYAQPDGGCVFMLCGDEYVAVLVLAHGMRYMFVSERLDVGVDR